MISHLNQKGQALLIVVLAMVVALTVGLAVVSRSITNLRNSQQEISSQQALSAAEAGVQRVIESGNIASGSFSSSTSYQASASPVSGATEFILNGNNQVSKDDAMYIWLSPYTSDNAKLFLDQDRWSGDLNIYWGDSLVACSNAALEIAVVWNTRAAPKVTRYTYDPCLGRASRNNFTVATSLDKTISDIQLHYGIVIPVTNGFLARVAPLYTDSHVGALGVPVSGGSPLPTQGSIITSTGITGNNVTRKLDVFQGYPEIPAELFPFSLFWP